jgi:putative component of membrane protein insertase Oxa1/YidC/SpoIIIJ protein YidD
MKIFNYILMFCYCLVRSLLGPAGCRFSPSCGTLTMHLLATAPLKEALPRIARQVLACHPWGNRS